MRLSLITAFLESIAPLALQEDYDNSGLLVGDPGLVVTGVLLCLDCTEKVVEEAYKRKCNLIIAHHPFIFKGLKRIIGKTYPERILLKAVKNDIAIYAIHTNLDNVSEGVNKTIADRLGLMNCEILSEKENTLVKLITFCPLKQSGSLRKALFSAGAGHIGNYDSCSFNTVGYGSFRPLLTANPHVGKKGEEHREKEEKMEMIFPFYLEKSVVAALKANHPYEEVAYDLVPLANNNSKIGAGMIGNFSKPMEEKTFLKKVKLSLNAKCLRHSEVLGKMIKKVAICGGAGSFLLPAAISSGADAFVSADFKYHEFFDAEAKILIADPGHYESEQFVPDMLRARLREKFNTFAILNSEINTNPIQYF